MSTTHHAAAIIGCKIDKSKVMFEKSVRSCEHTALTHPAKFCPECGKKLWGVDTTSIIEYNRSDNELCGFRVFDNEYDDYILVVGRSVEIDTDCYNTSAKLDIVNDDISFDRKVLESSLKPVGLWDEKEFGIWVCMWIS